MKATRRISVGGGRSAERADGSTVVRLSIAAQTERGVVSADYTLSPVFGGEGEVARYALRNEVSGEVYQVDTDLASCNCPDQTYRGHVRPCKHLVALRDLLGEI